jgi:alpha 1,2-mannosyltransferase
VKEGSNFVGKRDIDISSQALPLEASLRERLDVWRDAPGGRGDVMGEVELGQFTQWNLEVSVF